MIDDFLHVLSAADDWLVAGFYLLLGLAAFWSATRARNHALMIGAACMLCSCIMSNAAVFGLGFDRAPAVNPEIDAAWALIVILAATGYRNITLLWVFALFIVEAAIHVAFLTVSREGFVAYAMLNAVYAAQVLLIWGAAGDATRGSDSSTGSGRGSDHIAWGVGRGVADVEAE